MINEWLDLHIPEYAGARLFALRVVGRSMDLYYPDGTYVIAAHPAETGIQDGDHVVVRSFQGALAETTIKEIEMVDAKTWRLWPRSTDPAHRDPITIEAGDESRNDGPSVIGVVVADYRKRQRGRAVLRAVG